MHTSVVVPEEAYIIGACLGDYYGDLTPKFKQYGVGICAGKDKDFAEIWANYITKVYSGNPQVRIPYQVRYRKKVYENENIRDSFMPK